MKECFFEDLDFDYGEKCLIFLDIDGTLLPDGQKSLNEDALQAIGRCKRCNKVYLCTNSFKAERNNYLANKTHLPLIRGHRKPSCKILCEVPAEFRHLRKVVIGDKILTDGIFAYRIGAKFVKVKRKVAKGRLLIKMFNLIDDCIFLVLKKTRLWAMFF